MRSMTVEANSEGARVARNDARTGLTKERFSGGLGAVGHPVRAPLRAEGAAINLGSQSSDDVASTGRTVSREAPGVALVAAPTRGASAE